MALPIIPIMLGLALFAFASKKRTGSSGGGDNGGGDNGGGGTGDPDPPDPGSGGGGGPGGISTGRGDGTDQGGGGPGAQTPGTPCPSGPNEHAVWNENGECQVYWDDGVKVAVIQEARKVWEGKGSPGDICAPDEYIEVYDEWVPNPRLHDVAAAALATAYGVAPSVFPPTEGSPHWVQQAWSSGTSAIREDICGVLPGT